MTDGNVSPKEVRQVAEMIGPNWMKLGVSLGVPYHRLTSLSTPADGGPTQYAARMLHEWHRRHANQPFELLKKQLSDALKEAKRLDQARYVENHLHRASQLDEVFQQISENLTRDWEDVGLCLGLGFKDINRIKTPQLLAEDPAKRMLEMWYSNTDPSQRRAHLLENLRHIQRLDIVTMLEDAGNQEGQPQRSQPTRHPQTSPSTQSGRQASTVSTQHPMFAQLPAMNSGQNPVNPNTGRGQHADPQTNMACEGQHSMQSHHSVQWSIHPQEPSPSPMIYGTEGQSLQNPSVQGLDH